MYSLKLWSFNVKSNLQNIAPSIDYKIEIQKIHQCAFVKIKPIVISSQIKLIILPMHLLHIQMFIFQSF